MSNLTTKNFKGKLAGLVRSAKNQRDNVQAFIVFGLQHYKDHGNASYLTMLMEACIGVKSLPTVTLKDYIKEHANVKFVKSKGGKMVFKKDGDTIQVKTITETWYDWKGGKHNKVTTDVDVISRAKTLLAVIRKGINEGHIKEGQTDKAAALSAALSDVLTA